MTSDAKLAANRANALSSTGPRTTHGKEKASQNARKHNAYTKSTLPGEDTHQFKELLNHVIQEFEAETALERWSCYHVARTMWAIDRLTFAEQCRMAEHVAIDAASGEPQPSIDYSDIDKGIAKYVVADPAAGSFERARVHLRGEMNFHIERLRAFKVMKRKRPQNATSPSLPPPPDLATRVT